jgi:hypothetical protein
MSMADVLNKINLAPDFSTALPDSTNFMFIHKKVNDEDVYFVANQQDKILRRECAFRTGDKTPEIWNPLNGAVAKQGIYSYKDGCVKIPVTFTPYQAYIFVFKDNKPEPHIEAVSYNGDQIFPTIHGDVSVSVPEAFIRDNSLSVISGEAGDYNFTLSNHKEVHQKIDKSLVQEISKYKCKMTFNSASKNEIAPIEITELKPLSQFDNPEIKYFAGTVKYNITFEVDDENVLKADSILLDLGNFEADAQVVLNGKLLGNAWLSGTLIPAKNTLEKNNSLEVTVATTFRNRFIGDFAEYGAPKNLWSSAKVSEYLNKNSRLKPSGLMEPIKIRAIKINKIN